MDDKLTRRSLLRTVTKVTTAGLFGNLLTAATSEPPPQMKLPNLFAPSEREPGPPPAPEPSTEKLGFAVVGLGHLALEEILPGFLQCADAKVTALVSGHRDKALEVARRYGIPERSIYDYANYDQLRDDPTVQAVYVVLPNGLHAEYTIRAAQAGKHVLCEKPMANRVAEGERMIEACRRAGKQLMIAYRLQYEPYNHSAIQMARAGKIGGLRAFDAANGQDVGDPSQWRLHRAMSGGGCLPDVGIYCLNAARYLSGEEPTEVFGMSYSTPGDPRFREVEEIFHFMLRFPSGLIASCSSGYGYHRAQSYRLMGTDGWIDLDPAFPYGGLRLRWGHKSPVDAKAEEIAEERWDEKSQFAREIDHFTQCIREGKRPHTPGEEGLQDLRIIEALYRSAREGKPMKLASMAGRDVFRGPAPS